MKIKIIESQEVLELSIIDPRTGINWINDFCNSPEEFIPADIYSETGEDYECTRDAFDWWLDVAKRYEKADFRLCDLQAEYGRDALAEFIEDACCCDLEDMSNYLNQAMDDFLESLEG
jgi:hypothetical protein